MTCGETEHPTIFTMFLDSLSHLSACELEAKLIKDLIFKKCWYIYHDYINFIWEKWSLKFVLLIVILPFPLLALNIKNCSKLWIHFPSCWNISFSNSFREYMEIIIFLSLCLKIFWIIIVVQIVGQRIFSSLLFWVYYFLFLFSATKSQLIRSLAVW